MRLKLVLDTNLVVSGHLNPDGLERLVLNLALTNQVHFFITAEIVEEYRRVLHQKKFKLEPAYTKESLQLNCEGGHHHSTETDSPGFG